MERLLSEAATELAIRSEVESTLTSILQDVEHAHALEQSLRTHNALNQCRERLGALKVRYDDREAAWEEDRKEKERLGMLLLEQIVKLSAREADGQKSKREMETRLRQLEDEKRNAGGNFSVPLQNDKQNVVADCGGEAEKEVEGSIQHSEDGKTANVNEDGEGRTVLDPTDANISGGAQEKKGISDTTTEGEAAAEVDEGCQTPLASNPKSLGDGSRTPLASNSTNEDIDEGNAVDEDCNNQSFVPHELDEATLMRIFEYSDPMDVMNFAQTNKALILKVNVMFGMSSGGGGNGIDDQQQSGTGEGTVASPEEGATAQQPAQPKAAVSAVDAPATAEQPASTVAPAVEKEKEADSTSANGGPWQCPACTFVNDNSLHLACEVCGSAKEQPVSDGKPESSEDSANVPLPPPGPPTPGPSHKRQGSGASVATTGSAGTVNPFSQVSSWFGSAGGTAATDTSSTPSAPTTASTSTTASTTAAPPADGGSEIKLNAAMATSMASKLTPAELSVILRMREKLQRCEADANKWRLEKEDAVANLASVEAVKEFLVARVRDTERVVQTQKEEMAAAQKKNLEDQEVIVYLDEKVKGMEKAVEEMKSKEAATKQQSLDVVNKNEKKARVLSDMLRFEREQMVANEKEWKKEKKVLVKEVKNCRARILVLEAEVEGCGRQNEQLKHGLMSLQTGSMSPGGKHGRGVATDAAG